MQGSLFINGFNVTLPHNPPRVYGGYRVLAALSAVVYISCWTACMNAFLHKQFPHFIFLAGCIALIPLLGIVFNLAVFTWPYSVVGTLTRTSFPSDAPVAVFPGCWGRVGNLRVSLLGATWLVFESGIGFQIACIGNGFLPLQAILAWNKRRIGYTVYHNSPEVRGPIAMPESVYTALAQAMSRGNHPFPAAQVI
jgi:hypothetical protein